GMSRNFFLVTGVWRAIGWHVECARGSLTRGLMRADQTDSVFTHIDFIEFAGPPLNRFIQPDEHFAVTFTDDLASVHFVWFCQDIVLGITRYIYDVANFDVRHYTLRFHKNEWL